MYTAIICNWNGACYASDEVVDLDAETLDEAIEEVRKFNFGDADTEDWDIEVSIEDEGGDVVHTETFQNSWAENAQDDMDDTWEDEGEFSTHHLGHKDGTWFRWETNGGSRGAHDRTDGSGRWIESYEAPEEITVGQAIEWLASRVSNSTDEAIEAMGDVDAKRVVADIVRDAGDRLWFGGSECGVYRVRDTIYTVCGSEAEVVDIDDAIEFASEYDDDAESKILERAKS